MSKMGNETKIKLIKNAKNLFAKRGFYGVSLASIAEKTGVTKQALLHYFRNKENLYGEVLDDISNSLNSIVTSSVNESNDPKLQLMLIFDALLKKSLAEKEETMLLMREILDNKNRSNSSQKWYLKDFLKSLTLILSKTPNWENASEAEMLSSIYMLLGSIEYSVISEPTLNSIYGKKTYSSFKNNLPLSLRNMVLITVNQGCAHFRKLR